ncbi:MAG: acyl-CoA thioesterase [Myxococcota bacterium]
MDEKTSEFSQATMTEIVLPQHANALGTAFGGTVMSWVDVCAAVVAQRHCGRIAVTASIDQLDFTAPLRIGDVAVIEGRINAAFRTSLEIEVHVDREDSPDCKRIRCADALLTFVNVDDRGTPCPVPELRIVSAEDHTRLEQARARKRDRLARRKSESEP